MFANLPTLYIYIYYIYTIVSPFNSNHRKHGALIAFRQSSLGIPEPPGQHQVTMAVCT